jgi:hypothetical protein
MLKTHAGRARGKMEENHLSTIEERLMVQSNVLQTMTSNQQ